MRNGLYLCYTLESDPQSGDVRFARQADRVMGCNSLCIKDMAGIMSPQECYDLVTALKQNIKIPVYVHTHATTGLLYDLSEGSGSRCGRHRLCNLVHVGGTSQPATGVHGPRACSRWASTAAWMLTS